MDINDMIGYVIIETSEYRKLIESAYESALYKERFNTASESNKKIGSMLKEKEDDCDLYKHITARMTDFLKIKGLYDEYIKERDK